MNPPIGAQQGGLHSIPCETSSGPRETSYAVQRPKVLIVDDEADVILALKLRLENAGYRAIAASNGAEALDILRNTNVDLILTDLMMPNLDGLELTRRVRQDPKRLGVQVLLFSCNDDPVARNLALEFGALDYLSKDLGAREIVSRIQQILTTANLSHGSAAARQPAYGLAEADLISQLQAISNSAALTPRSESVDPAGEPLLGGAPWAADDLLKLAMTLAGRNKARRSPERDS
jgi:DNA-binding response OmpR family regulator